MTTEKLLTVLMESLVEADKIHTECGTAATEVILRQIQLQWLRQRPLALHTLN